MVIRKQRILFFLLIGIFTMIQFIISVSANGDEFDDNNAKDFGWVAIGLFSLSILYVILYQSFINVNKLAKKKRSLESLRDFIRKLFMKVKKPLSYLHYIAGLTAVAIILTHGISLILLGDSEPLKIILGLSTALVYVYYVVLGLTIKVVLKNAKKATKLKMLLYKIHTNLIIIISIGALHIAHLAIGD